MFKKKSAACNKCWFTRPWQSSGAAPPFHLLAKCTRRKMENNYTNTNTQIQIHKYKYTNTNTQAKKKSNVAYICEMMKVHIKVMYLKADWLKTSAKYSGSRKWFTYKQLLGSSAIKKKTLKWRQMRRFIATWRPDQGVRRRKWWFAAWAGLASTRIVNLHYLVW